MNKQLIFVFAAVVFAAVASANPIPDEVEDEPSQLALFETDEVETKSLGEDKAIFKDFCLSSRDEVRAYLKDSVNKNAAGVFNLMVDTVSQMTAAIAEANGVAVEEGSKMVGDDATQITVAVGGLFKALAGSGQEQLRTVFVNLKEKLNSDTFKDIAEQACANVGMALKPQIDRKLAEYKRSMLKSPEGQKFADVINKARVENLGCVTTSRLTKVATGCNMVRTLGPSLFEFFGL